MHYEKIHRWLSEWAKKQGRLCALTGLGASLLAAFLLSITYYVIFFFFALFIFDLEWMFESWLGIAIPLAVIALLFWTEWRAPSEYFGDIKVHPVGSDRVIVIPGLGANINPLAPSTINSAAKIISDVLCAAPRATKGAISLLRRATRLKKVSIEQCAAVLTVLFQAGGKKTYQEITDGVEGVDLASTIPAMRDIDGVVFFSTEPAGMSLTQELREELPNAMERS
jgi:hypothetical protein